MSWDRYGNFYSVGPGDVHPAREILGMNTVVSAQDAHGYIGAANAQAMATTQWVDPLVRGHKPRQPTPLEWLKDEVEAVCSLGRAI